MPLLPTWSSRQQHLILIASFLAAISPVLAGLPGLTSSRAQYLYRTLDPPSKGEPIIDYYIPEKTTDDTEDFPDFLYSSNVMHHRVVEFYSPMCPHCRNFAPHYIEFARHFGELTRANNTQYSGLDVRFYAVSCQVHRKICQQQKITRYPSVKIFPSGSKEEISIRYTSLHPSTLIKTLGIDSVDQMIEQETSSSKEALLQHRQKPQSVERTEKQPTLGDKSVPFIQRDSREIFNDAYLSFHTTLKTSVFMEEGPVPDSKANVLRSWLELLQKVLPPWKIQSLIRALLKLEKFAQDETIWNGVLDQFAPRQTEWSAACQLHESPYTCGLWSLFHILTVGVVDYNANIVNKEAAYSYLGTQTVADTLKDFIVNFFTCTECSTHFAEEYDKCSYGRCERLKDGRDGDAAAGGGNAMDDWKELSLWLLETHNGVNVRLQKERFHREGKTQLPTMEEQQSVMWPPAQECPVCWMETSGATAKYNATMMYNYLRLTYWPEDKDSVATREEILSSQRSSKNTIIISEDEQPRVISFSIEMQYAMITVIIAAALLWNKKRIERVLGLGGDKERGH